MVNDEWFRGESFFLKLSPRMLNDELFKPFNIHHSTFEVFEEKLKPRNHSPFIQA